MFYPDFDYFDLLNDKEEISSDNHLGNEIGSHNCEESNNTENNEEIYNNSIDNEKKDSKFINLSGSKLENFPTGYSSNLSQNENSDLNNFTKKEKLFNITKEPKKKKKRGRKKKSSMGGKHTKFSYDNMTRKFKRVFFESILNFIKSSMKKVQTSANKYVKPILFKIKQDFISDTNVNFNKDLIQKKLREIFSNNISIKYSKYGLDYNRKLIEKIYNEKIQTKVIGILEMTFLECLEHIRGSKYYEQLEGLENVYEIVINELENKENDEYMANFKEFANRFEQYYENKRSREK